MKILMIKKKYSKKIIEIIPSSFESGKIINILNKIFPYYFQMKIKKKVKIIQLMKRII